MFPNRPKSSESEEDLLKLQEEFFKNKTKPSVSVIKTTKDADNKSIEPNVSESIQDQLANTFEAVPSNMGIGQIVVHEKPESKRKTMKFSSVSGFPQAKRRDLKMCGDNTSSIFAQQMKKIRNTDPPTTSDMKMDVDNAEKIPAGIPSQSYIISGNDKNEIHKESISILSKMSEEEILEEKRKLMETMDPAIVAFLKAKRKETMKIQEESKPSMADKNKLLETVNFEQIDTPKDILEKKDSEKWLNFDTVETNKLLWMKDIDVPKITKDQAYEARFDFHGVFQPFSEKEMTEKSRTLYHHGEEPGRPGYTLQELFQLARSSVTQQKITALQTIANILALQSTGIYDKVIDLPTEQIFFVLRFCMDDNTPSVLNASVKAMRNLFYFQIDETCLDNMLSFGLGFIQPMLPFEKEDLEDDKTINDQQMAEMNLIKCLSRSDILIRLRYIINVVHPPVETIVYCLELLIRLSRDSQRIMALVFKCDGLISAIIDKCLSKMFTIQATKYSYNAPIPHALKLLRVLASRSKTISVDLVKKFNIMEHICLYLANDITTNTVGLKIQIESLRLWNVLLHYNLTLDVFNHLQPILLRILDFHIRHTNVNDTTFVMQNHAATLISTIAQCAKIDYDMVFLYIPILKQGLFKWTAQLSTIEDFVCSKLQITSAIINCFAVLLQLNQHSLNPNELEESMFTLIRSKSYKTVLQNIMACSNLLNDYEIHKTGASFNSLEAAAWFAPDHVIPTLSTKSPFLLLNVLTNFLLNASSSLRLEFMLHECILDYLKKLLDSKKYFLTQNWFTKLETQFIINLLLLAVSIKETVDKSFYYEIAVKCLSVFHSEQKLQIQFILENIVFSTKFYGHEVLLQRLNLSEPDQVLKDSMNNLDEISKVYIQVLGLNKNLNNYSSNIALDIRNGNVLPIDWIYSPIIALYSAQSNELKGSESDQLFFIKSCLQWIYMYETYFPSLASTINTADRFCRLSCIFLGSDGLFLNPDIHILIENCFKCLIKSGITEINFDKPIQGLNNFQDLYIQLLEQYQGVSYGDVLFGNFILLPLCQRHNVKWRKILWSEYAGIVQILNVTPEQCFLPKDEFLVPEENELSLLKCYRRLLVCGHLKKNTLLHLVAKYHVDKYLEKQKEKR